LSFFELSGFNWRQKRPNGGQHYKCGQQMGDHAHWSPPFISWPAERKRGPKRRKGRSGVCVTINHPVNHKNDFGSPQFVHVNTFGGGGWCCSGKGAFRYIVGHALSTPVILAKGPTRHYTPTRAKN